MDHDFHGSRQGPEDAHNSNYYFFVEDITVYVTALYNLWMNIGTAGA
ncbi:MAG: hypothetical protein MK179_17585 [Pirellulaceae bacterium]|nr:hypothetical protein [Pirellulaceae bacterium]